MTTTRRAPRTSGIQAPSGIFSRLEVRKTLSMKANGIRVPATAHIGHFQPLRITE